MPDLVEFLRARLAEDEAMGQAATPGPWGHNPGKMWLGAEAFESFDRSQGEEYVSHGGPSPFTGCVAATGPADQPQSMADAAHIARHDPARTLADVESKRLIIAEHAAVHGISNTGPICSSCGEVGNLGSEEAAVEWPCRTLRLLALPYAGHPDYPPDE